MKEWQDADGNIGGRTSTEVPTILAYNTNGGDPRWGHQVKDSGPRIERFKLGLYPEAARQQSYVNIKYPDVLRKAPELTQKPEDLTRDYLRKLHAHIIANLVRQLGKLVVDTTPIEYILTVPAIWTDKAKDLTRACAKAAGFGDAISMISEPEAAVTYALDSMDPGTLKIGDVFVLVDAGGGTGDLISYRIEEIGDVVEIKEVAAGTGALCGSSYLNHIFRNFLVKRFGDHEDWDDEVLDEAMQKFETWTKRQFRGEVSDFVIPVSGMPVNRQLGILKKGKLHLTLDEMTQIFEPVVSAMTTLVSNQITATKSNVKAVLLVGGFGQSPYLRNMIQEVVESNIAVLQPADGEIAVVKGALVRGLALTSPLKSRISVSSRVARKSFGRRSGPHFDENVHSGLNK
jgi:molecular chaperone DnaK (HSP70)